MQLDRAIRLRLDGSVDDALDALDDAVAARAFPAALVATPLAIERGDTRIAEAITRLLASIAGDELQALDRGARSAASLKALALARWAPAVDDVARAQRTLGAADALGPLVVLSLVRDGHVRGAATLALERDTRALATLALLVRTDDVVGPIRERAGPAFERRLTPALARDLVHALPLLDRLEGGQRSTTEGTRARAAARDLLLSDHDECRAALDIALRSPLPGVRQAAARFAVGAGSSEALTLHSFATSLDDPAPHARVWAAQRLAQPSTPPGVARALLPKLTTNRMPSIRRAAVKVAARVGAVDVLEALTVDVDAGTRALARQALGRAGGDNERARLREMLATAPVDVDAGARERARIMAALGALAEIGRPADFSAIAPWLHDERPRVVAEALRALVGVHASGGLDDYVDVLHDKLAHESAAVALEAARGLALVPAHLVQLDVVEARLGPHGSITQRRLRAALEALLPASSDADY